ncbi:hypothetical protein PV08_06315 [Exophiala spinifera]|uniref:Zn(2)-C6 fungal-type domain-containing protein n=1 Tax=Exophiala spinifera TaxID=91928 RepID=A0A0D2BY71_9EURO|nr:uncharacterized protein PV08_06315 [Exophiala spinifera]KIW16264.1 hypothetical protein PV08_06315 [Exophiala spinifera]
MSQPLAPRPSQGLDGSINPPNSLKPRKISTACGACKQRKTRCTGGNPCEACASRKSPCVYDATSDQRRKIANQRNVQELADTQVQLERHRQLLGGILAIVKAGDANANEDLARVIRSGVDLSQLAAHVRNECRANTSIQVAFDKIDFTIDGPMELPSPSQILGREISRGDSGTAFMSPIEKSESNSDVTMHSVDQHPDRSTEGREP